MVECLGIMGQMKFNPKVEEYEAENLDTKIQMFYAEVRAKDGFFYNFVEKIIKKKKKKCTIARAFRDIFKVLKLHSPAARAILRTLKTSLVPIYHEMHSRSYDFLYLLGHQGASKNSILEVSVHVLFTKGFLCI